MTFAICWMIVKGTRGNLGLFLLLAMILDCVWLTTLAGHI